MCLAVVLGLLVIALVLVETRSSDRRQTVATTNAATSTTTTSSTTTSSTTTSTVVDMSTTVDSTPTTPTTRSPSSKTAPEQPAVDPCHGSYDPACGYFHWDPPVNNQPITITVTADKTDVHPGDTVTFTAVLSDPDAQPRVHCVEWLWDPQGDGGTYVDHGDGQDNCFTPPPCDPPDHQKAGGWTPPPPNGGTATVTFSYTFNFPAGTPAFEGQMRVQGYSNEPKCSMHLTSGHSTAPDSAYASGGAGAVALTLSG